MAIKEKQKYYSGPDPFKVKEGKFDATAEAVLDFQLNKIRFLDDFRNLGDVQNQFFPIDFFRRHPLISDHPAEAELVFQSSGTTASLTSKHYIRHSEVYEKSIVKGFEHFFGKGDFVFLALLPNYIEQGDSSLVFMVETLIQKKGLPGSGFFLDDFDQLNRRLNESKSKGLPVFFIGVSYALLDFGAQFPQNLSGSIIVETGGMKGRRKELIRSELHSELKNCFEVKEIFSEYGMTELLSQAWAEGENFVCPPWMKVVITDPFLANKVLPIGKTGRINIIDLANIYSCSFISTDDLGLLNEDGSFQVLGRLDKSIQRGCNLLYEK